MVPKRVVIAVERTERSDQAVAWLTESGLLPHSQVLVMHVADKANHDDVELPASTAAMIQAACPSTIIETSLQHGSVGHSLIGEASEWRADLIVLGADQHSALERLVMGTVSQFVIEQAHCPVIIARAPEPAKRNNVLIAVDNSDCSAAALEWISEQPWAPEKNFVIVSISHALPGAFNAGASTAQAAEMLLHQEVEESLLSHLVATWSDMLAQDLQKQLVPFAITEGDPVAAIVEYANHWPIDMIVMGSHGRGALAERLLGSVCQAVARQAPCTAAVVRGIVSRPFADARKAVVESSDLATIMAEKPHPGRISGSVVGNNLTVGMSTVF